MKPQRSWSGTAIEGKPGSSSKKIEEITGFDPVKWLIEETLRAMVRTAVEDGTPGSDALLRSFFILFSVPLAFVAGDLVHTILLTRHAH